MDYKKMGERIRNQRKRFKLTQEQLANMVFVSPSFCGHIERGSRVASIDTLERICYALGLSADYLLGMQEGECMRRLPNLLTPEQATVCGEILRVLLELVTADGLERKGEADEHSRETGADG